MPFHRFVPYANLHASGLCNFALEREYQEYPEVTCSEQEKEEIKKQLTANITELVSTLLAGENKNADVNGAEPDGLSIAQIMKNIPEEWNEQRKSFGVPER